MKSDAGKTRGAIERLLIEHGRIRQNAGAIGKRTSIVWRTGQSAVFVGLIFLILSGVKCYCQNGKPQIGLKP
jgi:hypothetical protein